MFVSSFVLELYKIPKFLTTSGLDTRDIGIGYTLGRSASSAQPDGAVRDRAARDLEVVQAILVVVAGREPPNETSSVSL